MKSGFVSIIGRPNVGKSTLLNAMLKRKISITSPKPQTTRNTIQGVYNSEEAQIIFVDTPGIHKPFFKLGEVMNKMALLSQKDVEVNIIVIDASIPFGEGDQYLIERISDDKALFFVLNKIDLTTLANVESLKAEYSSRFKNANIIEISALKDVNIKKLITEIIDILPEGPRYFPIGIYSDHPESFTVSEIIREKILYLCHDEVPHSIAVVVDKMTKGKDKIDIFATIIVERDSQKGIIIGKGGKMIKRIGMQSRYDIEKFLECKINLQTFVKVEEEWRNSTKFLKEFGYKIGE